MAANKRPRRLNLAVHMALLPMAITALLAYVGSVLWSIRISFTSSKMFTSTVTLDFPTLRTMHSAVSWLKAP